MNRSDTHIEVVEIRRVAGRFVLLMCVTYAGFSALHRAFPGIQPGSTIVVNAKRNFVTKNSVFARPGAARVMVFGDSRILSGFRPDLFDELAGPQVESFNMGLPGVRGYVAMLRQILEQSPNRPTHVFITKPWEPNPPSWVDRLTDDVYINDQMFPFRHLMRDAMIFTARAGNRGGLLQFYQQSLKNARQTIDRRGYYFIESQSLFADHRLPDNFRQETDDPSKPMTVTFPQDSIEFDQLLDLRDRFQLKITLVPMYARESQYAPPSDSGEIRHFLKSYGIDVKGPSYFLYPNRLFSDTIHANEDGAEQYTRDLWNVISESGILPSAAPN